MPTSPFSPPGAQAVTTLVVGTCEEPVKDYGRGVEGSSIQIVKRSQSDCAKAQSDCVRAQSDCVPASRRHQLTQNVNLRCIKKQNAPNPGEPGPMRFEQGLLPCQYIVRYWLAGLLSGRLGRKSERNSQSRYRIWSVQNRSRRCSDLFSVANSSFEIPPTCSTVLTCFW